MALVADGLAQTAINVNHAHLLGLKITKSDAAAAEKYLRSRYFQNIPQKIREAKSPNPRWAQIPSMFNLTDHEVKSKPKTITGESVANASMKMIHSREAARALYVLREITGSETPEADELCANVRVTGDAVSAGKKPFF